MNGELLFLVHYNFTALVQRIFKCDAIWNKSLTPDKLLNVLTYWLHCFDEIRKVGEQASGHDTRTVNRYFKCTVVVSLD